MTVFHGYIRKENRNLSLRPSIAFKLNMMIKKQEVLN